MPELVISIFVLLLLILYATAAGADFGGGMWDLLATGLRATQQRRAIAKALAPIWEANHVWLILVIVILFTGFPRAFAALMTGLNIPITLMLIGIVLRGSAFIFRKYDSRKDAVQQRWSTLFGVASFTPLIQGLVLGAVSTGQIRVIDGKVTTGFFAGWLTPFAFACGALAVVLCAFLASTYMTIGTARERDLQNDFRLRALCTGFAVPPIAVIVFLTSRNGAPEIFHGLTNWWALGLLVCAIISATAALLALWFRRFALARVAAIAEVTLILVGWGLAQYPKIIIPDVGIFNSSAPAVTLRLLIMVLVVGAVILFPSLVFLYSLFNGKDVTRAQVAQIRERPTA
jgi:cytochrome d ubiquinol oxidase subunit II